MEKRVEPIERPYMQNRELSWLRFNERVLQESQDLEVPLFERLKFLSIFSSNLDEFFMIRVGSLCDLAAIGADAGLDNKTGMSAEEQLKQIYQAVIPLYAQRDAAYFELRKLLAEKDICHLDFAELAAEELDYVKNYFKRYIHPVLSPQIVDSHHPFPFIPNKELFIAMHLESKSKAYLGLIPVPDSIPELIFLPGEKIRFIPSIEIISAFSGLIFNTYKIRDKNIFRVTRNADINLEDRDMEVPEDFRSVMKNVLKKRKRLEVVRIEFQEEIGEWIKAILCDKLKVVQDQLFISRVPISINFEGHIAAIMEEKQKQKYYYKPFHPQPSPDVLPYESVIDQVCRKDLLQSYPYESMEPFLRLIKEASGDNSVVSIKITIYRLAQKAKLVEYLCAAAESGKEVVVLIELRARFDEQNNIDWSERLEEAGCRLIYGIGEYKVHSKVCQIIKKSYGDYIYITQFGTGNYNEKTTELYTDLSFTTANQEIGKDAATFFKNMTISNLSGEYKHLMVAPNAMKNRIIELIEAEAEKKEEGRILIKVNSITDIDIIRKLMEASCAGVKINLIVRGICCILPGVAGKTENISVISIVGRFLEHSRVYRFGMATEQKLFIASADFMTRNMERRVEIGCPIYSEEIRDKINDMLDGMLYDTEKARVMQADGTYGRKSNKLNRINIQELFIEEAKRKARVQPLRYPGLRRRLRMVMSHSFMRFSQMLGHFGKKAADKL